MQKLKIGFGHLWLESSLFKEERLSFLVGKDFLLITLPEILNSMMLVSWMQSYWTNRLEKKLKLIVMESIIMQEIQNSFLLNFMSFGLNGKIGLLKIL